MREKNENRESQNVEGILQDKQPGLVLIKDKHIERTSLASGKIKRHENQTSRLNHEEENAVGRTSETIGALST